MAPEVKLKRRGKIFPYLTSLIQGLHISAILSKFLQSNACSQSFWYPYPHYVQQNFKEIGVILHSSSTNSSKGVHLIIGWCIYQFSSLFEHLTAAFMSLIYIVACLLKVGVSEAKNYILTIFSLLFPYMMIWITHTHIQCKICLFCYQWK